MWEWLVIVGLGVWALLQQRRLDALARRLHDMEMRVGPPAPWGASPPQPAATSIPITPEPTPAPQPAEGAEPLLLDTPLAPDELLLDTPLPEASNDDQLEAPSAPPPVAPPLAEPVHAEPPPPPRQPDRKLEQWLAENGLAWLGGGAFALGAIFLVSFAAQQAWFTPLVQLICAVVLGAALIGASDWARRFSMRKPPGHPLAAALLAGAGVVAFYATVWAAHGLYRFIDWPTAAVLLTLCAALLIALSFLHGQAIGVLAIAAALLAPALTNAPTWPPLGLTLYTGAVALAGLGLAAFKRWPWVAAAVISGLYFWFASAIIDGEIRRALALLCFAALGGITIAFRPPLDGPAEKGLSWRTAHDFLPTIAIILSSVFLILPWGATTPAPSGLIAAPAWVGAMFVLLAAAAVRARVAMPWTLVVAIAFQAIGFALYLDARPSHGPIGADFYPFVLLSSFLIVVATLGAKPNHRERLMIAIAGASGAALLTILSATSRPDWHSFAAYAPLFTGAALMAFAAWFVARTARDQRADFAVDAWAGAGALLLLLGIESGFAAETRTAAHAGAALMFAIAFSWRGWRALRVAALSAAAITVAHALSPNIFGAALTGAIPLWGALIILGVAALLLYGASYFVAQEEPRSMSSEALSSAAVIVVLIGIFLALRWIAAGGGAPLDRLTEISLRALALIAAGHIVMPRAAQESGRIGQWRGHALMGAGLLYALLVPGIGINPWWGFAPATVIGPYLLDTLAIAFAAPAALALLAANRLYMRQRWAARAFAAAGGLLALMWAMLTLRRAFHADAMPTALVGLFEGACYALVFLAGALAVALVARQRAAKHADGPFTQDLAFITRGCAWAGLVASGWIMLLDRHPWWGIQEAQASNAVSAALAILAQAVAMGLALVLGRALSRSPAVERTRFAAASAAILFAWSFGHAAIRWAYQQGAMDDGGANLIGIEGMLHALWPLALVLIGSRVTQLAPHRDTIRPYVYDLQAIWATAVWPAMGFATLGLWIFFNPWWGLAPARGASTWTEIVAPATPIFAAWLTKLALGVPHVRNPEWFTRTATVLCIAHLFLALTLMVRWLYHGDAMAGAPAVDIEMWTYSAVWAIYGAAVFWLGVQRNDALLRWSGLTILVATTAYVFFLTFTRLQGIAQFGSALGLAVVLMGVAWFARTNRKPGDLVNVTPNARRERRHGRRQRTP